jgi:hypothetical protein
MADSPERRACRVGNAGLRQHPIQLDGHVIEFDFGQETGLKACGQKSQQDGFSETWDVEIRFYYNTIPALKSVEITSNA